MPLQAGLPPSNRSTSAGYRFPIATRPDSSDRHQQCIPTQPQASTNRGAPQTEAEIARCDVVTQDKVWKQAVNNEKRGVSDWERNWGFLTEFDPKGRPKTPQELPDKVTMFSDSVPNTNSGNYGSRVNTNIGETMQKLEFNLNSGHRKKKLGNDLICY